MTWSVLLSVYSGMALQPQSGLQSQRQMGHWKAIVVAGAEVALW